MSKNKIATTVATVAVGTKVKVNRSEIARAVGVDLAHISRIFSGKATPSLPLAMKIANHLGITVDELCATLDVTLDAKPDLLDPTS